MCLDAKTRLTGAIESLPDPRAHRTAPVRAAQFISTEQTGTGSAQNIAHGLGSTPTKVFVAPTDLTPTTVGQYVVTEGAHDGTNVVVTVTTGKKYKVLAWV